MGKAGPPSSPRAGSHKWGSCIPAFAAAWRTEAFCTQKSLFMVSVRRCFIPRKTFLGSLKRLPWGTCVHPHQACAELCEAWTSAQQHPHPWVSACVCAGKQTLTARVSTCFCMHGVWGQPYAKEKPLNPPPVSSGSFASLSPNLALQLWPPKFWHLSAPIPALEVPFLTCKWDFYSFPPCPLPQGPFCTRAVFSGKSQSKKKIWSSKSHIRIAVWYIHNVYLYHRHIFWRLNIFYRMGLFFFFFCEALLMMSFDFISVLL